MKNFDASIRKKIAQENLRLTPEAEIRFEQSMARARMHTPARKRKTQWIAVASAACILLPVIMLFALLPAQDTVQNAAAPADQPEMLPLIQPVVEIAEGEALHARMQNPSDEIWLIEWQADEERTLIWLEPGAECEWRTEANTVCYRGLRVTADVLHWVDTEADEAEQQELIADAFANGALVLAPGGWENGEAGEMLLPLPDGVEGDAVEVYLNSGDLTDGGFAGSI